MEKNKSIKQLRASYLKSEARKREIEEDLRKATLPNTYRKKSREEIEKTSTGFYATIKLKESERRAILDWHFARHPEGSRSVSHAVQSFLRDVIEDKTDNSAGLFKLGPRERTALEVWFNRKYPNATKKPKSHMLALFIQEALNNEMI